MSGTSGDLPGQRPSGRERSGWTLGSDTTGGPEDVVDAEADRRFDDIWTRPGLSDRARQALLLDLLVVPRWDAGAPADRCRAETAHDGPLSP